MSVVFVSKKESSGINYEFVGVFVTGGLPETGSAHADVRRRVTPARAACRAV